MRDRDLVRLHWPLELRPAFDALLALDDALAGVVASASQPALGAIKLAWWRERLEALDHAPPPAEPRLRNAAAQLLPRGVAGAALAELTVGWATLLDETPDPALVRARGATLFALGAKLLGQDCRRLAEAGGLWAEVDVARRLGRAMPAGRRLPRAPRAVRPLTALAALAQRDCRLGHGREPEAVPQRAWALLCHRLTGR